MSLALKYRPREFSDVSSQKSVIKILERQIETKSWVNSYIFAGPQLSGIGKTTIARILAKKINNGYGEPIEIDAASNNGVDNVRSIIDQADQRALDAEYKIYIIDECHMLSNSAWNAMLKLIEEPPKYTIFMFCTTDLQKVPETIQNRCQQYRLSRVDNESICNRLKYICKQEGFTYNDEAIEQITKMSMGSMRQAIVYLDKCKDFSISITLDTVLQVLGNFSYDIYFGLVNAIIDKDDKQILELIDNLYAEGADLKTFVDLFFDFILDLTKYVIFRSFDIIKIPARYKEKVEYTINVENPGKYYNHLLDKLLELKQFIKGDPNIKTTIEVFLIAKIQFTNSVMYNIIIQG